VHFCLRLNFSLTFHISTSAHVRGRSSNIFSFSTWAEKSWSSS